MKKLIFLAALLFLTEPAAAYKCTPVNGYLFCPPHIRIAAQKQQFKERNRYVFAEQRRAYIERQQRVAEQRAKEDIEERRRATIRRSRNNADTVSREFIQLPDGTWVQSETHIQW